MVIRADALNCEKEILKILAVQANERFLYRRLEKEEEKLQKEENI